MHNKIQAHCIDIPRNSVAFLLLTSSFRLQQYVDLMYITIIAKNTER